MVYDNPSPCISCCPLGTIPLSLPPSSAGRVSSLGTGGGAASHAASFDSSKNVLVTAGMYASFSAAPVMLLSFDCRSALFILQAYSFAAKRLGYAESNPWLDIDGVDSAAKIVIIANHVLKRSLTLKDVAIVEGIRRISPSKVKELRREGKKVRMVASVERRPEVKLLEVPESDSLSIGGACNVVRFRCEYSGERVVSGPAAGGVTTSSAVMRDLLRVGGSVKGG